MLPAEVLTEYLFHDEHTWIHPRPAASPVGLTEYAQDQMGEVVFVELPDVGTRVERDRPFVDVESVKAVASFEAPVSGVVVEVNSRLVDAPELINADPFGAGWVVKCSIDDRTQLASLHSLAGYHATVLEEVEHVLQLDESGRLRYFPAVRVEGQLVRADAGALDSVLTSGFVNVSTLRRQDLAAEFEALINEEHLTEQMLQRFFESNPEFLLGTEYESLYPQVSLRRDGSSELRPDFILRPFAGVSYDAKIVELKMPGDPLLKTRHDTLYARLSDAVGQLRAYARYFDEQANREYVASKLGFTAYAPRLTLVVGKTIELETRRIVDDAVRGGARPVDLVTYGDLLIQYREAARRERPG